MELVHVNARKVNYLTATSAWSMLSRQLIRRGNVSMQSEEGVLHWKPNMTLRPPMRSRLTECPVSALSSTVTRSLANSVHTHADLIYSYATTTRPLTVTCDMGISTWLTRWMLSGTATAIVLVSERMEMGHCHFSPVPLAFWQPVSVQYNFAAVAATTTGGKAQNKDASLLPIRKTSGACATNVVQPILLAAVSSPSPYSYYSLLSASLLESLA